jgi:hypothetical protein
LAGLRFSGELFRVEVDGELKLTRMEYTRGEGYYSVDGYPLFDGLRATIGCRRVKVLTTALWHRADRPFAA